jgi:O-acetyl-ADP-ribose deacetylase (regulator of RNase III)
MKIILSAIRDELADAWRRFCGDIGCVTIHNGSILQLSCDAIVSPANSFGFMNGGIDQSYAEFFGWQIQERLQSLIKEAHYGELLVGQADIIQTEHHKIPFLIAAPTMRVPMSIEGTINPYLAARAALLLIKYGSFSTGPLKGVSISDHIRSVAFPGLGTGVGRVNSDICAFQVKTAIEEVILGSCSFPETSDDAQRKHEQLRKPILHLKHKSKAATE